MKFKIFIFILSILKLTQQSLKKKDPLSKKSLVGTYKIGDQCTNLLCSELEVYNYWQDFSLVCPEPDTKAIIEYNEKENFYTLKMEAHFIIFSNKYFEVDFDELFIFDEFIQIPMYKSDRLFYLIIQPCNKVIGECDSGQKNKQYYIWRKKSDHDIRGYYTKDLNCGFTITKISDKTEILDIEKKHLKELNGNSKISKGQFKSQKKKYKLPLPKEDLLGKYNVGNQCGYSCDPLHPMQPQYSEQYLDCPVSNSTAIIKYNKEYDFYTLKILAKKGIFNSDEPISLYFSKINFFTEQSLIFIPMSQESERTVYLDNDTDSLFRSSKTYYDYYFSYMTIQPCWLKKADEPVSENCSNNKNIIELSIQKWTSEPFFGEPCGFTLTKLDVSEQYSEESDYDEDYDYSEEDQQEEVSQSGVKMHLQKNFNKKKIQGN